jgi:hypothetical protein
MPHHRPDHPTEPTVPELARTALAQAKAATLVTTGCTVGSRTLTVVSVEDQPDGRPLISVERSSPTVRELVACSLATLSVAGPSPFRRLDLTGPLKAYRVGRPGHRTYRLSPVSGRLVGATNLPLALGDFYAARPDPLARDSAALLDHLAQAHAAELLACVRAQGHTYAEAAVPRAVDRYGIELVALGPAGVHRVRLPFPGGPIDALEQVPPRLLVPLACRCRGTDTP